MRTGHGKTVYIRHTVIACARSRSCCIRIISVRNRELCCLEPAGFPHVPGKKRRMMYVCNNMNDLLGVGACVKCNSALQPAGAHKKPQPLLHRCVIKPQYGYHTIFYALFPYLLSLSRAQRYNKYLSFAISRITKIRLFLHFYPKSIPFPEFRGEQK